MGILFRLFLFFLVALWGSLTFVLIAVNVLLHPVSFFHRKKREGQPGVESVCVQDSYIAMCVFHAWPISQIVILYARLL